MKHPALKSLGAICVMSTILSLSSCSGVNKGVTEDEFAAAAENYANIVIASY